MLAVGAYVGRCAIKIEYIYVLASVCLRVCGVCAYVCVCVCVHVCVCVCVLVCNYQSFYYS